MDRERGKGRWGGRESMRDLVRVGGVIRQIQIGVVV